MTESVTVLLKAYRDGEPAALNTLAELLYPELKAMARRRASGGSSATTLVNETFLKLLAGGELRTADRREFFALAATVMRRIIVDEVRYHTAEKRSGQEVTLAETILGDGSHEKAQFLLEVDEMLGVLEADDARLARVFECRYFAGLTTSETAEALDLSVRTVERCWSSARERIAAMIESSKQ